MTAKLLTLAVMIVSCCAVSGMTARNPVHPASPAAAAVALLPESIGNRRIMRRWKNPRGLGVVEEGALYAAPLHGDPVLLDFYRNGQNPHNAISCFMSQGESIVWERARTLRMSDREAQFDLALLRTGDGLRLVAATECSTQGCSEQLVFGQSIGLLPWLRVKTSPSQSVVPVSIVLEHPAGPDDLASVEASLMQELEFAAGQIDLSPTQRLAALQ